MRIEVILDIDSSDEEPFGTIRIRDSKNSIEEEFSYIDTWIEALESGVRKLESAERLEIDLIDEPDPLVFEKSDGRSSVSYRGAMVFAESIADLDLSIKEAKSKLVQHGVKFD